MKRVNWQNRERVDIRDLDAIADLTDEGMRNVLKSVFGVATGVFTETDPPEATQQDDGTYSVVLPEGLTLYTGERIVVLEKDYEINGIVVDSNHPDAYITVNTELAEPPDELLPKENRVFWVVQQNKEVVQQVQTQLWPIPAFGWAYPTPVLVTYFPLTYMYVPPANSLLHIEQAGSGINTEWFGTLPQPPNSKVSSVSGLFTKITNSLSKAIRKDWDTYAGMSLDEISKRVLKGSVELTIDSVTSHGMNITSQRYPAGNVTEEGQYFGKYYPQTWVLTFQDGIKAPENQEPGVIISTDDGSYQPVEPVEDYNPAGAPWLEADEWHNTRPVPHVITKWGDYYDNAWHTLKVWAWKTGGTCGDPDMPCWPNKVVVFIF